MELAVVAAQSAIILRVVSTLSEAMMLTSKLLASDFFKVLTPFMTRSA